MKYRTRVENWIVESISNQYDHDDPGYPGELLDSMYDFEDRIMCVLTDLSDDDLVDIFYQHSCGYTFEELEEDIEYEFMHEYITCIITRADRIRLEGVDKNKSTMKNFKTVIDLYERSLMTASHIDAANPSEMSDAEWVIDRVLEVLHDKVVSCDTCIHKYNLEVPPCDGCLDYSGWERK
jgi:hypothetical protein